MPLPLLIPAAISAAGGIASLIAQLRNKPRRSSYNPEQEYRAARETAFGNANAAASNIGTQMGPRLYAQGLGGSGLGNQMVSGAQQNIYSDTLRSLPQLRASMYGKKSDLNDQYGRERSAWESGIWGDVGNTLGNVGGSLMQIRGLQDASKQQGQYMSELERLYGGGLQQYQVQGGQRKLSLRELLELAKKLGYVSGGGYGSGGQDMVF